MGLVMAWNLFIDDERSPPNDGRDWKIARSYYDVGNLIYDLGMPSYISFDHDLGENQKTGYDIAKYLVMCELNEWIDSRGNIMNFPENFDFYVHSQNPVGKTNIEMYLNNYMKHKG